MRLASLVLILGVLPPALDAQVPGACLVNDSLFQTASGGCMDLTANRAWSAYAGIYTWSLGGQYCNNLVEGGFSDWRMPTLAELTALQQNGGLTHLNIQPGRYWSSTTQGNKAWYLDMQNGQTGLSLKGSSYNLIAVRTPMAMLGGGGQQAGGARDGVSVSHLHQAGRWTVLLNAPHHADLPYLLVAGVASGAWPNGLPGLPIVLTPQILGSQFFDPGSGRLDGEGRAVMSIDMIGLRIPEQIYAELRMVVVVLDPTLPEGGMLWPLTPSPTPPTTER